MISFFNSYASGGQILNYKILNPFATRSTLSSSETVLKFIKAKYIYSKDDLDLVYLSTKNSNFY
jgi:hypothetical protein